jgi:predicted DCC family thiol-disulfide oxidoreductase YuxK
MSAGVVVYDGDCGICQASARWIERHIPSLEVQSHYEYGVEELGSVWLVTSTYNYEGAEAVARVLMLSSKSWMRICGRIINAPIVRLLATGVYRVIARNRRHISRAFGLNACAIPSQKN